METYPKTTEVQPGAASGIQDDTSRQTHRDQEPSAFKNPQQVAEEALGKIDWIDEIEGFLDCPGKERHTTRDSYRDCRIRLDGTPTVFCHHDHCRHDVEEANQRLRATMNATLVRWPSTESAPISPMRRPVAEVSELREKAAQALPQILENHAWDLTQMKIDSPVKFDQYPGYDGRLYLTLYHANDIIWIGDNTDSGSPEHHQHWRTAREWLGTALPELKKLGPYICTSTFKPGTCQRKKENVVERKFLVVEFDRIDETVEAKLAAKQRLTSEDIERNKKKSAAVIRWLKDEVGLRLRAVVDSGNKSIHAHFEMPPDDVFAELEIILPELKCDPATLRPTQPVRMPGYFATDGSGRQQPLLFLDLDKSEHPPCRLPSTVLPLIDDEPIHTGRPIGDVFTTEGDGGLYTPEARGDHGVDVCPASTSSNSSGCADSATAGGNDHVTSSISSDPEPDMTSAVPNKASYSSNSFPPETPPLETTSTSSTGSLNSSPQAPPPPTAASSASSNSSSATSGWPNPLPPAAFHGIAGKIVRMIEPHTEADPAALLIQLLAAVGNIVGRNVFITVDGARHNMNLFAAIVGETSKGRKGTAWNQIARLVSRVDEVWKNERVTTGLSSGEGVIWAVRDAIVERKPAKGPQARAGDIEEVIKDPGIVDKRLFVVEGELANTLKVMTRDGNTLSPVIRQAWDGNDLNTLVKNSPAKSTAPHISIVGHITKEELLLQLRAVEASNGFANRFIWTATKRSKLLPEGGVIDEVNFDSIIMELSSIIRSAKFCGEVKRSESARELWRQVYQVLSEGKPGMVGAITGRAEAQVMRLSALYAIFDRSKIIEPEHHEAAMAVWRYSEATVRWIFGDKVGDKDADKILSALRKAGAKGLSRTDIWKNVFSNNKSSHDLDEALQTLVNYNFAENRKQGAVEQWFVKSEVRI